MNYATGHCFNVDDMFCNFDYSRLDMSCKDAERENNDPHRDVLTKKIFRASVLLILNDIINNNVTFNLPTGSKKSDIHVTRTSGEQFKKARRNGKWQDVDYLRSNFSGNLLTLNMYSGGRTRTKQIYVDKNLKDKITENTNKGKLYC